MGRRTKRGLRDGEEQTGIGQTAHTDMSKSALVQRLQAEYSDNDCIVLSDERYGD